MKRKKLIIIASVLVVVIILGVLVGSTVFAETPTPTTDTNTNPQRVLMSKVAGILGINQADLEAAFTQAQKEMRSEALANRLAKLVADGKLTQEQADQYKAWVDSKPDVPALVGPDGGKGFRGGMIHRGMMGRCFGGLCPRGALSGTPDSTATQ